MPDSKLPSINLVASNRKFMETFLNWSMTVGRALIILTETVALSAFFYRFILDRQLIDIKEEIKQKQNIVSAFKTQEETYTNLHERLTLISEVSKQGKSQVNSFRSALDSIPPGMVLKSISLSQDNLKIEADVPVISSLSTFVESVRKNPDVVGVSIDKIENRPASANITAGLTIKFKD